MSFTTRPLYRGTHGLVAAGHYLAAAAGYRILLQGGNAIDAAAAAAFALAVVEPHLNGLAGEVPILLRTAKSRQPVVISGQGGAPRALTLDFVRRLGLEKLPGDGMLAATVPALMDAWRVALEKFGTMTPDKVLAPAIELADKGWPAQKSLCAIIDLSRERILREWPTSADVFLPGGRVPKEGQILRNPGLAKVLKGLASGRGGRKQKFAAMRRYFYEGPVARAIEKHCRQPYPDASGESHHGVLSMEDLAGHETWIETPVSNEFRGWKVFKPGFWSQGPVFLQMLAILDGFDLRSMGHNSADYLHTWIESAKLAFADREAHYGDPRFAQVNAKLLLSEERAKMHRQVIHPDRAGAGTAAAARASAQARTGIGDPTSLTGGDTTHLDAADRYGNLVSATQSGAWLYSSPVIEGLGFPLGTRAQMFSLQEGHPNVLAPGKRPRTTLTPSMAIGPDGRWLAFGTPGGDQQDQWTNQFFLNVAVFGMNLQEAIDQPTVHTKHFPDSFYPREAQPMSVHAEDRIRAEVIEELRRRGHDVKMSGPWDHGRVQAISFDGAVLEGGVSPRKETAYVVGH
jgi:gamma-glutamyltranspeptidase/glutathione hydrolase